MERQVDPLNKLNEALAEALGVDLSSKDVAGIDVRIRPDKLPEVVVHRVVTPAAGLDMATFIKRACERLELRPKEMVDVTHR